MQSYFIDTHTHLFSEEFNADIDAVITNAQKAGVQQLILPAIDSSTFEAMMLLAEKFPTSCFPTIGLHPTSVKDNYEEELAFVKSKISSYPFVAIGEIGIDCYWSMEHIEQQRYVFREQLSMAVKHKLPVIIHARESFDEIFAILQDFEGKGLKGIFHGFSGTISDYLTINRFTGFKLGIGGVLTFKNAQLAKLVKDIDIADIVLETDAPYLTPAPYRGKRNESAYIPLIAQKLAEVKGITIDEVAEITTNNAKEVFIL